MCIIKKLRKKKNFKSAISYTINLIKLAKKRKKKER